MKVLKAAACLIAALIIPLSFLAANRPCIALASTAESPQYPQKDGRIYARADTRNAYFCSEKNIEKALFAVPYTYCVEILVEDGDWYCVRYAQDVGEYRALTGYCRKEGLTIVDELPENLFLNYPVTVSFKSGSSDSSLPALGEITVTAAYYGVYYRGAAAYSYVSYGGEFGYVQGANDDYPLNDIPVEAPPEEQSAGDGGAKLATALIITGLAVAAVAALFFTGRRRRTKKPDFKG